MTFHVKVEAYKVGAGVIVAQTLCHCGAMTLPLRRNRNAFVARRHGVCAAMGKALHGNYFLTSYKKYCNVSNISYFCSQLGIILIIRYEYLRA